MHFPRLSCLFTSKVKDRSSCRRAHNVFDDQHQDALLIRIFRVGRLMIETVILDGKLPGPGAIRPGTGFLGKLGL